MQRRGQGGAENGAAHALKSGRGRRGLLDADQRLPAMADQTAAAQGFGDLRQGIAWSRWLRQ